MKKIILLLAALLLIVMMCGCTKPGKATEILTSQGYTNIEITGYDWFECSEDDLYQTGFIANAPNGTPVEGVVCGGMLKGNTVRFD